MGARNVLGNTRGNEPSPAREKSIPGVKLPPGVRPTEVSEAIGMPVAGIASPMVQRVEARYLQKYGIPFNRGTRNLGEYLAIEREIRDEDAKHGR